MLDVHIIPRLGEVKLRSLTAELVGELRAEMAAAGVGDAAARKTLVVLQSMLERAVEWRRIDSNPAKAIRKPSQARTRVVRPLPPQTIEAMRAHLINEGRALEATLVAVLAYAGLRSRRGARAPLARRPRADRPGRALGRVRQAQVDQDRQGPVNEASARTTCATASSAYSSPRVEPSSR